MAASEYHTFSGGPQGGGPQGGGPQGGGPQGQPSQGFPAPGSNPQAMGPAAPMAPRRANAVPVPPLDHPGPRKAHSVLVVLPLILAGLLIFGAASAQNENATQVALMLLTCAFINLLVAGLFTIAGELAQMRYTMKVTALMQHNAGRF